MDYRLRSLLGSEYIRSLLFRLRCFYFINLRKQLRTMESKDAFVNTIPHNLKAVTKCLPRMEQLIRPLSVIESVSRDSRILVIGPRNEFDLIVLAGHGFSFRSLRGLDLISYSPKIDLGDMHAMPYPDNSWDVVLSGWSLSYSAEPAKVAKEILRVVRDGGFVGVGLEYATISEADMEALVGYHIEEKDRLPERINSVEQILDLFRPHVKDVFFCHDAPLKRSHTAGGLTTPSDIATIFSVNKT